MTHTHTIDAAPADLTCPLCNYNLRGLTEPRCPECGFAFTWAELLDERRSRHPWLFEHAPPGRRLRALWTTYWRTCRPRRFWREVTPANPVWRAPLLSYWIVTVLLMAGVILGPLAVQAGRLAMDIARIRAAVRPWPGSPGHYRVSAGVGALRYTKAQLDAFLPPVWSTAFGRDVADAYLRRTGGAFVAMVAVAAAWPWLTFTALLIFGESMRRAKVNVVHVLRTAIYGCDFGLLITAAAIAVYSATSDGRPFARPRGREVAEMAATLAVGTAALCAAVATYRVTVAYKRYLRFHLPLATVLASQVIAWLVMLVVAVCAAQAW